MFDRTDPVDLQALQDEVNNDPLTIGYDPLGPTQDLLDLLNAKNYTVSKPKISAADIRSSVYLDAYDNLLADRQEWLRWMTGSNGFEEDNVVVTQDLRDRLTGVLGGSTSGDSIWAAADDDVMEPLMLALIDVPGSRAEVLFGYSTVILREDWIAARDYVA
jgi:hypothetical protein